MDRRPLSRLRWFVRATLVLGVSASVAANILHARPNPISQTIAAWPPLALLLTVELIARVPVSRALAVFVRIVATTAIAGIAAWVSYWHMAGVTARYGEEGASVFLLPLSVDGLIVVASVCLVELGARLRTIPETPSELVVAGPVRASLGPDQPTPTLPVTVRPPTGPSATVLPSAYRPPSVPAPPVRPSAPAGNYSPVRVTPGGPIGVTPGPSAPVAGPSVSSVRDDSSRDKSDSSLARSGPSVRPIGQADRTVTNDQIPPSAPDRTADNGADKAADKPFTQVKGTGPADRTADRTDGPRRTATDAEIRTIIEDMTAASRTKLRAALAERGLTASNDRIGPALASVRRTGPADRTNGHDVFGGP